MSDFDNTPPEAVATASAAWEDVVLAITDNTDPTTLADGSVVQGITLNHGDRFLCAKVGSAAGIYRVSSENSARASDADAAKEFPFGRTVRVTGGTYAGLYMLATEGAITLGSTSLTFSEVTTGPAATAKLPWAPVRTAFTSGPADPLAVKDGDTVNGVALNTLDRFVVTPSRAAAGIYVVGHSASVRASDADDIAEFVQNRTVRVTEGTQAGVWRLKSAPAATLGVDAMEFEKASADPVTLP